MSMDTPVQDKAPKIVQKQSKEQQASESATVEEANPILQMCESMGNKMTTQLMEETSQLKSSKTFNSLIQRLEDQEQLQAKENKTGMPDNLKTGIESLSGMDMSDVKVNYNSSKPAEVGALAYTQGTDIHVGPGQEQHLAHEAWHVAQQGQGRVKPTTEVGGMPVNDNPSLEKEADVMGNKATQMANDMTSETIQQKTLTTVSQFMSSEPLQRMPLQFKDKMQEEIEAKIGGETGSKNQVFDAFVSILKSKGFKYDSGGGDHDINNTFSQGNCGRLARALNAMFEVFTGEKAGSKFTSNIYVDIDGDYIDPTVEGNCKSPTDDPIPAYFFTFHSYLDGFDPTTGKKSPPDAFKADSKPISDFASVVPEGKELTEKQSEYKGYYDYGSFYIIAENKPNQYVKVGKGNFFNDLEVMGLIRDKV